MRDQSLRGYWYIAIGLILFILGAGMLIIRVVVAFIGLYLMNHGFMLNEQPPLLYSIARLINIVLGRK